MIVSERMPRDARNLERVARRRKGPVVEVLGLSGVLFEVQNTRSSGAVRELAAWGVRRASHSGELIGMTRSLLRVFGDPNRPSEKVSVISITARDKSSRFHLSARISPIRIPVRTATSTTVRHGSGSAASKNRSCSSVRHLFSFPVSRSPMATWNWGRLSRRNQLGIEYAKRLGVFETCTRRSQKALRSLLP
jgi:hypothetical protein